MNQTVSEKTPVDYLFVMQNSEPKHFVFFRSIDIYRLWRYLNLNLLYKNFTLSSTSNKNINKTLINLRKRKYLKG